jgi:hypothetical protein
LYFDIHVICGTIADVEPFPIGLSV